MSNLIDNNPIKGSEVNIVGMTNLFQAVLDYKIKRMVFPSSQSVYGTTSKLFNNQPVKEDDYCGLQHQLFTYAVMKLLNEFMAKKYIKPVPKTQREISTALQTPFDVRVGNPNDAKENSQFPPENQANIPFNRSTKMSFKGDATKPYTVGIKDID